MRLDLLSLLSILTGLVGAAEEFIPTISFKANAPLELLNGNDMLATNNGSDVTIFDANKSSNLIVDLPLDGGWYKFYFGQQETPTAYTFRVNSSDYTQISVTDAYCPGDSWNININGSYLFTTPRVPSRKCDRWTDNPDVALYSPVWSNTKFMLPGSFNLTLFTKDSPFQGGAGFIRADSRLIVCPDSKSPFMLVEQPLVGYNNRESICRRVGGVPAHIMPNNALAAANSMTTCSGMQLAWFGKLSLVQMPKAQSFYTTSLGCLAFSNRIPGEPSVEIVDCNTPLPVLCQFVANV